MRKEKTKKGEENGTKEKPVTAINFVTLSFESPRWISVLTALERDTTRLTVEMDGIFVSVI